MPVKWLAQTNLIFAIGAKYSQLIGTDCRGNELDHMIYMTRAVRLLGLENTVMSISGPDLELVQAVGNPVHVFLPVSFAELTPHFADCYVIFLLLGHRTCGQSMVHDRSVITVRHSPRATPSQRRPYNG
jgi:hypothetical protein